MGYQICLMIVIAVIISVSYKQSHGNLLSPTLIVSAVFFLSCGLMLLLYRRWDVDFLPETGIVIAVALICMLLGEQAASLLLCRQQPAISYNTGLDRIRIGNAALIIFFVFSVFTLCMYIAESKKMVAGSELITTAEGQSLSFLRLVREVQVREGRNVAYYVQHMYTFLMSLAHVLLYVVIYNLIFHREIIRSALPVLTIVFYLITSTMTGGRTDILHFFAYSIVIFVLLYYQKYGISHAVNKRLMIMVLVPGCGAVLLFFLSGTMTGKTIEYDSLIDNFANYFSSSIYALNEYIREPERFAPETDSFGIHCFFGIYTVLRKLGLQIPEPIVPLEFITCGKYETNIYTALRRYLQDFGMAGLALIMAGLGALYKGLFRLISIVRCSDLMIILVSMICYPLFFMSIEERFFLSVVTTKTVYQIIYVILIGFWVFKGRFHKEKL